MSLDQFKRDTRKIAKANGIEIKLMRRKAVRHSFDNLPCSGYFCDVHKELCVATKGGQTEWIPVLVHESCHMDQYIDNRFLWDKCAPAFTIFSNWINGKIEQFPEEEVIQDIIRLELDCEKRAIEKIKKYDLDVDMITYIQSANMCLYGYLFFYEKRKWCNDILERKPVMDIAPKRLRRKYDKIPIKFYKALQKEYNKLYAA